MPVCCRTFPIAWDAMRLFSSIKRDIDQDMLPGLYKRMALDNIRRGRILALSAIIGMSFYALLNIAAALLQLSNEYAFFTYLSVYAAIVVINALFLLFTHGLKTIDHLSEREIARVNRYILLYLILFMTWGSLVSILTQPMYGQLTIFMITMMICSVAFLYDDRKMLIAYVLPFIVLAIGMPFFQPSRMVLLGNYANLLFFFAACWMMSRVAFKKHCSDYVGRALLERTNSMLERQMRQNELMNMQLEQANRRLKLLSQYDELTGASNRRSFRDFITGALNRDSANCRLSIIMFDIDHFKTYNDQHGHAEGDKLLVQIAEQIHLEIMGPEDMLVRWGGDEFLFASLRANDQNSAGIAERVRQKILTLPIECRTSERTCITISGGVCCLPIRCREDVSHCIELADKALYIAKSSGRNCIRTAPAQEFSEYAMV